MASKGIEKLVSEASKKGYSVFRKGDRIEICKPNRKMVRLVILPDGTGYRGDVQSNAGKSHQNAKANERGTRPLD
ncbi:hypothetical protein [Klebsiella pneumoniae]|uniref:hypothetical protein n=1 Tax=Klebsiella pneumoniae TaxID=573 RepID=UPI002867FF58|nr:hypothetical protein [Klebsiella pneumoniae]WMW82780.1 hypothetical protein RG050_00420 [Klebsiella pneumoniae]